MLLPENRSLSKPPKTNHLFFSTGPPMVPPLNSSLLRRGPLRGLHCGFVVGQAIVPGMPLSVGQSIQEVAVLSAKTEPCHALVPPLVMIFTTEPALRPYSGPKLLV